MKVPPIADPYVSSSVQNNRMESPASTSPGKGVQDAGAALGKQGVSVSISDPVRSMVQGGVNDGVVNMEKVLAVRATIEQGAFKVNPEVVADRLLGNAQEVLSRGRA
jgi:negative regulator of flagellin synthesis FlgM